MSNNTTESASTDETGFDETCGLMATLIVVGPDDTGIELVRLNSPASAEPESRLCSVVPG